MSDFIGDLGSVINTYGTGRTDAANSPPIAKKDKSKLDLDDYLKLMVAMFQNQTIDNTADISDMMNNMVQMSVVEAISSISSLIEESTALNYAASLVGKQVTVGVVNNGQITEIEGYVAATGTYNGQQVIFLKDKNGNPIEGYVPISSIMAIGWLSETAPAGGTEKPENPGDMEDPANPVEPENPANPVDPENPEEPEEPGGIGGAGGPGGLEGAGESEEPEEPEEPVVPEDQPAQGAEPAPEETAEEALARNGSDAAAEAALT